MNGRGLVFVDTNILVYGYSGGVGAREERAREVLRELLREDRFCWSTQVMQELSVTLTRKYARTGTEVRGLLDDLAEWPYLKVDAETIRAAGQRSEASGISFWDGLILAAAEGMGAEVVYSEALNAGQIYGKVRVVNPLLG